MRTNPSFCLGLIGGGNSLRPYSQQRPMRTNLSCRLGLIDNGQYKSTNRLPVVVPHGRPHGIMKILKNLCMLLPKALTLRAIKDTMALVADSIGGTKGAPVVAPEASQSCPAQPARNEHPPENGKWIDNGLTDTCVSINIWEPLTSSSESFSKPLAVYRGQLSGSDYRVRPCRAHASEAKTVQAKRLLARAIQVRV